MSYLIGSMSITEIVCHQFNCRALAGAAIRLQPWSCTSGPNVRLEVKGLIFRNNVWLIVENRIDT